MPTVPRVQRQVSLVGLPGARKTARATFESLGGEAELARGRKAAAEAEASGQVAGALGQVASRVSAVGAGVYEDLVQKERAAADDAAVMKAQNDYDAWRVKRLWGTGNNDGVYDVQGEAAMPLPEQVAEESKKLADDLESKLSTPEQKRRWAQIRVREEMGLHLDLRRYVNEEVGKVRVGVLKSNVENAVNSAITYYQEPERFQQALEQAKENIRVSGAKFGLEAPQLQEETLKATTKAHVGAIFALLADDRDQDAAAWFKKAVDAGEIAGDQLARVKSALEEGALRSQSQRAADDIIRAGGTLTEQREKARTIDDAKLRDEVMSRLEHEDAVLERAKREDEENRMRQGYDILDKNHDVAAIPTTLWSSFDGATRSAMIGYAEKRARGSAIVTDDPTYYSLLRMAGDDPDAFVKENLLAKRSLLDDGDFKQLASIQLSLKSTDRRQADKELAPFRSRQQLVDDSLVLYKINPNAKPDTAEGRSVAQLRRMVDRRVEALQDLTGKKASNEDVQSEIDRILSSSVTTPGSWWAIVNPWSYDLANKTKRLIDYTIGDVPADQRSLIEAALKARNRPVSDETILELYLETQLRSKK